MALYTIAKQLKPLECPTLRDQLINKDVGITECYTAI